jgi:eukaryotic-like serine/threonine-protein kinase
MVLNMNKTETRTKRTRMLSSAFLALAIQLSILGAMVGLSYSPFFSAVSPPFQNALAQTENGEQVTSNNTAVKTYENAGFGITMQYPSNWSVTQIREDPSAPANSSIVAIFKAPTESQTDLYQENVIINVQGPFPDMTLAEYTENSLNAFRNMSDTIEIFESSPTTISGLPAHEIVYTSSGIEGLNLKKTQLFTVVNNNMAYVFTFSAEEPQFNKYLPDVQKMISSIQINEQAVA